MNEQETNWVLLAGESSFIQERLASLLSDSGLLVVTSNKIDFDGAVTPPSLVVADTKVLESTELLGPEMNTAPLLGVTQGRKPVTLKVEPDHWIDGDVSDEDLLFQLSGVLFDNNGRRRYPRALVRLPVDYTVSGLTRTSICTNLSLGGMFILSLLPPDPGTDVDVELYLEQDGPPLHLEAKTLYSLVPDSTFSWIGPKDNGPKIARPGFAAQFIDPGSRATMEIQRFVTRSLKHVKTGNRDFTLPRLPDSAVAESG